MEGHALGVDARRRIVGADDRVGAGRRIPVGELVRGKLPLQVVDETGLGVLLDGLGAEQRVAHPLRGIPGQIDLVDVGETIGVHPVDDDVVGLCRSDLDADDDRAAQGRAVRCPVGEGVRPGKAGIRGIGEGAVRVQAEHTLLRGRNQHCGQRVAIDIAVVAQDARRIHGELGRLWGGVAVGARHRRVIHRGDGEADRSRGAVRLPISGPVGETVRPVVI